MTPAVRNTIDALIGITLYFAACALVTDAHAADIKEIDMKVIRRYFVAEGDKASAVAKEGLRLASKSRRAGIALSKEFGALGTFGHGRRAPFALVWDEGLVPDPNPGFLPAELHHEDGKRYHVCRPDKRTKIGKDLAERMRTLPDFDFSDYACKEFGVYHSTVGASAGSQSGMAIYHSVAGYMKETLIFSIPFGGDQGGGNVVNVAIPQEFREITAGEYLDLTRDEA